MEKVALSTLAIDNSLFAATTRHNPGEILRCNGIFKRVGRSWSVLATLDVDSSLAGLGESRHPVRSVKQTKIKIAAGATGTISRSASVFPAEEAIDYDQRAADLEKAFNSNLSRADAVFTCPSIERLVADLEAQPRLDFGNQGTAEASSSAAAPPALTIKSRSKQRKKTTVSRSCVPQPSTSSPQGEDCVSLPADAHKDCQGKGKRRLDLPTRIALRKGKQAVSVDLSPKRRSRKETAVSKDVNILSEATYDVGEMMSEQAEQLIKQYGNSIILGGVNWSKLDTGILSGAEEASLATLMKPMKALQRLRRALSKEVGREATDEELAAAAKLDVATVRRRLELGRAARNKLIQHNLRLVLFQAHKYYRERVSLSLHDLCQEGVQGLIQGVDKFDPQKGYRFSTYAIYWIRNSILRAQTRSGHLLRSPFNLAGHKLNIKRTRLELLLELGRPATDEEVAAKVGLGKGRFRDIVRSNLRAKSLHQRSRITGEEYVENIPDCETTESKILRSSGDAFLQLGMDDVLDSLKPKESIVLRQRFGLDGKGERSLGEIGRNLNLSREMVRRYEARGLLKLKHPTRLEYLRSYLTV